MSTLEKINPNCAGIDIGSEAIFIAVEDQEVVSFGTFTDDYLKAIAYLQGHSIRSVVMEATGIYWMTLFDMLEAVGLTVTLVNGKEVKALPGRKSDVADCQWLQQLHTFGLLRPCFVPNEQTRQLRTYTRLRADHLASAAAHIQHMHKALSLMNVKVQNVLSQMQGVSGMRIMQAIVQGERDAQQLAALCQQSILKSKRDQVVASLKGNFKSEHVFALKQALAAYDFSQNQIAECDKQIEALLKDYTDHLPTPPQISSPKPVRHNPPDIDELHVKLMKMTEGRDPARLTGLTDKTLLELLAETGTKLREHWPTEKHFTSWLGLAPPMHQSGKSRRRRRVKKNSRAGQIFREAALSIAASKKSALGGFYRRMKSRKGFLHAMKATARKIATIYYRILTDGLDYVERGIERYQEKYTQQQIHLLKKRASTLGLRVVPA